MTTPDRDPDPVTIKERILGLILLASPYIGLALVSMLFGTLAVACGGCAYKGGKIVDGTNLAIGITVPGTEWSINALDYVGGVRVAGNDSTHLTVTNEVDEDASFFGCVTIKRKSRMTADIEPLDNLPRETAIAGEPVE